MDQRRAVFQNFSWFYDLYKRNLLELSPPYQRRSVWNDEFKTYFLDTVLNNYPCPAIFLYEEISPEGTARYKVVDGKQRLSTLIDFVSGDLSVGENSSIASVSGKSFEEIDNQLKLRVWRYQFAVEFIPQENETIINNIFDRINRNVARLTPQELRHARLNGKFISQVEDQAVWMAERLGGKFPNISQQARRQMKDVETTATLFLFLEQGEVSTSQANLDDAFVVRDAEWENEQVAVEEFRQTIEYIRAILASKNANEIQNSRLRNQADFYSLFAAVTELRRQNLLSTADEAALQLSKFMKILDNDPKLYNDYERAYINAARSASNDKGPRRERIEIVKKVLLGSYP